MKNFIFIFSLFCISQAIYAQSTQVNEIKKIYGQSKDLSRSQSFEQISGKTYKCEEFVFSFQKDSYLQYLTMITFQNVPRNYYGSQSTLDYLEYAEYRRIDQERIGQVPHFGCDGIEWGVAHLDDAPYLQMANLVGRVGNTNSGPCYELKFRINEKSKLVAVGVYENKVIHALKCEQVKK